MSKKRVLIIVVTSVIGIALSAILAYLFWEGGEPQADYSWLVSKAEASTQGVEGFVLFEPAGVHHIADPIAVRFGVVYDPRVWEISDDMFRGVSPMPQVFELKDRKSRTIQAGNFVIVEATLTAQCLTCRNGTYDLDFGQPLRAKNKNMGEVKAISFADSPTKIQFAPMTTADYRVRDGALAILKIKKGPSTETAMFLIAALFFIAAIAVLFASVFLERRMAKIPEETKKEGHAYMVRVQELQDELSSGNARAIAHSLYALLLLFRGERGAASKALDAILEELRGAYGREGIEKESLGQILKRVEIFLALPQGSGQGEV